MSILGVEIGTAGCLAVVYSREGHALGRAQQAYPLQHPEPGAIELDADEVMRRVHDTITTAVKLAGDSDPVQAICASAQGEAVIPVDAGGRVLGLALTTFDSRPVPEAEWCARAYGIEHLQHLTGLPIHPMYALCKILWWKNNRPETFAQTRQFLSFDGLLLRRLGLDPVMDYSMGGRTMAMELRTKSWSAEICEKAGLDPAVLPPLVQAGTRVGVIPAAIAHTYHLPAGVLAVAGGHDQACAALGCGVMHPGMAMDAMGAVECIAPVLAEPVVNPSMLENNYGCYPHVVPGRYLTLAYNFNCGSLLQWYRDTLGELEESEATVSGLEFYEILLAKAGHAPAKVLVLPHFTIAGTPWLDARARGAIVGLTLGTSKAEIIKGIFDGIAYEMRLNLERLALAGVTVNTLRVIGNGARSATWLQLKADIFRHPVEGLPTPDAPCRGAALLGGVGAGIYQDLEDAVAQTVTTDQRVEPHASASEQYDRLYELYAQLYPALKPIMHQLP
ncbi:MAG: FGGY-family carbohydrate kinase [Armatimonadota bacterium]